MTIYDRLRELGFTQYEIGCYLTLIEHHPVNGSRLSRLSGVSRSKIYEVLQNMAGKGLVVELAGGLYAPLPPDELVKRLRSRFEYNLESFEKHIKSGMSDSPYDYVWSIRGYTQVMGKAKQMVNSAEHEIYLRLDPRDGAVLDRDLKAADQRGVGVRYIALGPPPSRFDVMVVHPEYHQVERVLGGRPIDIIVDRREALVGLFLSENADESPINWTRNRWFIISSRDSLRHDFYHYFLHKTYDLGEPLTAEEKVIYDFIKSDH